MITWKNTESGGFSATCGEYELVIYKWHPYEGAFYRNNKIIGETGDKPSADEAKNALLDLVFEQIKKDVRAQHDTIAAFWELKRSTERDDLAKIETFETRSVKDLIDAGYVQTSAKYRLLTRVPPGKTALQAIEDEDPNFGAQVLEQCENLARSQYLRICGRKNQIELTPEQFAEFKRLKGPVA